MEQTSATQALNCGQTECVGASLPGSCTTAPTPRVDLAEALARFESEAVRGVCATGRYRCRYFVWGEGPPLLFIHGMGDSSSAYVPMISVLAKEFRCIAYDQPTGKGDGAPL